MRNKHPVDRLARKIRLLWRLSPSFRALASILIAFCTIYFGWLAIVLIWRSGPDNDGPPGQFGDAFGVINTLFSGAALLLVALTIMQGQRQLRIQQKELEQNTAELRGQRLQLQSQTFRNQFFQMLASWQQIVNETEGVVEGFFADDPDLDETIEPSYARGRHAFRLLADLFENKIRRDAQLQKTFIKKDNPHEPDFDQVGRIYLSFHSKYQDILGHYFRMLYHLVKYVDSQTDMPQIERYKFVRIVRAHLSQSELVLLYGDCLTKHGKNFRPLVEKYRLLHNMSRPGSWTDRYQEAFPKAFK